MKVLDAEFAKVLRELSDEGLKKFINCQEMVEGMFSYNTALHDEGIIHTQQLKKMVNTVRSAEGLAEYDGLDDSQVSKNAGEELLERQGIPTRRMLTSEVESLAKQTLLFRKGKSYVDFLQDQSMEDMKKYRKELEKDVGFDYTRKYEKDSKYGLDYFEKQNILSMLQGKKMVQKLVSEIPARDLSSYKEKFEQLRNNLEYGNAREFYDDNMKNMIKRLFGDDVEIGLSQINISDIAEAFDERERANQSKAKNGFWTRLKNFFNRNKTKALPVPENDRQTPDTSKDKAKAFRKQQENGIELNDEQISFETSKKEHSREDEGR